MSLREDLESEVKKIFKDPWTTRDGTVVPESDALVLGNDAVNLEGTVLYADLSGSTKLVESNMPQFAASREVQFLTQPQFLLKILGIG